MYQQLRDAIDRIEDLPIEEQNKLCLLLMAQIEEYEAPTESKGRAVLGKAAKAIATGTLATADFAIKMFLRTRANERTIQPTRRGAYPAGTQRLLYARQDGHCIICGKRKMMKNLQVDHIVPVVRGGRDAFENYQLLCAPCNQRKGIQTNKEFYDRYKGLVSRNMLKAIPEAPGYEISQKELKAETQRTRPQASVQQFRQTKYISASTKIHGGSLATGAASGVGWFFAWPIAFPNAGDFIGYIALFGGALVFVSVFGGLIWRAKHTGLYDQ